MILHPSRDRAARRGSEAAHGDDEYIELYLRDSLELDPEEYTGRAELRGKTSPASPQPNEHSSKRKVAHGTKEVKGGMSF